MWFVGFMLVVLLAMAMCGLGFMALALVLDYFELEDDFKLWVKKKFKKKIED